ncbi:PIN domain-containing protein [Bacillus infantis]|uniref:PIN domain-containing protein n=1 Tax=Bacillus infantis TaxID=324767 RepID=UPI00165398A2|nr:PIN domain-containing protein [Bacillus infantis]
MNFFLDTNILYDDYYLERFYTKLLVEFAEESTNKIYLSRVVYEEYKQKYRNEILKLKSEVQTLKAKGEKLRAFELEVNLDSFEVDNMSKFKSNIDNLVAEGILEIIEPTDEIFPLLLEKTFSLKKPYGENNQYKDTLIWLTYADFAEKHSLNDCFIITNNTRDFAEENKKGLHKDLLADSQRFKLFNSIKDLFQNVEQLSLFEERYRFLDALNSEEIIKHISQRGVDLLHDLAEMYVSEISDISILCQDYFMGGYVEMSGGIDIREIKNNFESFYMDEKIYITGYALLEVPLEVYLYNMGHDSREDKYLYAGGGDLLLSSKFELVLNQEYEMIEILAGPLNIEKYKDYIEMFREEHEYFDNYTD